MAHLTPSRSNGRIAVEIHQTSDVRGARSFGNGDSLGREAMSTTPSLGYIAAAQALPEVTHNSALSMLQILASSVIRSDLWRWRRVPFGAQLIEGVIAVSFNANARLPNANTAVIELLVLDISVEAIATIAPEGEAKQ
jgi:hypothetical protein